MALRQEDRSILDAVTEDVRRLRGKLGGSDRGKIDQYLDAVRDVERRIQLAEAQSDHDLPEMAGPVGAPPQFSEYYKLMTDLMVLAWQTDMTRVCTFQIGHEMSGRAYPEVGFGDAHHSVTHHRAMPSKIAKVIQINIFHTKLLAYYLDKLRSTPDGDGSLLDHCADSLRRRAERRQSAPLYGPADSCCSPALLPGSRADGMSAILAARR